MRNVKKLADRHLIKITLEDPRMLNAEMKRENDRSEVRGGLLRFDGIISKKLVRQRTKTDKG